METCKDNIEGYDEFYGYLAGVLSGNFDITDLFVDSTLKIGGRDMDKLALFLDKLAASIGSREGQRCDDHLRRQGRTPRFDPRPTSCKISKAETGSPRTLR